MPNKTLTFKTDILPYSDGEYNLGNSSAKWKVNGHDVSAAAGKDVDTTINPSSSNLPTSAAVASFVEQKGYIDENQIGAANGVAGLDGNGKVPASQLPSYVDDVVEYPTRADFPITGTSGIIYIAQDTNMTYRWGGSVYVDVSSPIQLGDTAGTAFPGDRGKTTEIALNNKASAINVSTSNRDYTLLSNEAYDNDYNVTINVSDTSYQNVIIADSKKYLPNFTEVSENSINGLSFTLENNVLTINGTATANTSVRLRFNGANLAPLNHTIHQNDSVTFGVLYSGTADKGAVNSAYSITCMIGSQSMAVANYANNGASKTTITSNDDYEECQLYVYFVSQTSYNNLKVFPYIYIGKSLIKPMSEVDDGILTLSKSDLENYTQIYSPFFNHHLDYIADTKTYIDNHLPIIDFNHEVYSREYYVSPEMFGAAGDGATDDTEATQSCINYAIANDKVVKGFGIYKITDTIIIDGGENMNVYLYTIVYTGTNEAIKLYNTHHHFNVERLYALNGGYGIVLAAKTGIYTTSCEINANIIYTSKDCIRFVNENETTSVLSGHKINVQYLRSVSGCGIKTIGDSAYPLGYASEVVVNIGTAIISSDFAFRLYSGVWTIESGNFESCWAFMFIYAANARCENVRIAESIDKQRYEDESGKATAVKITGNGTFTAQRVNVDLSAIDVSERVWHAGTGQYDNYWFFIGDTNRLYNYYYYYHSDGTSDNGARNGNVIFKGIGFVYGNRKGYIPTQKYILNAIQNLDMTSDTDVINPYQFDVKTTSISIKLNDSYCPYGINEFVINQPTTGVYATVYNSDNELIFNGQTYGSGKYRITIMQNYEDLPNKNNLEEFNNYTVQTYHPNRVASDRRFYYVIGDPLVFNVERIADYYTDAEANVIINNITGE